MKVVVAVDGSKYGPWGLEWTARLPFVTSSKVLAVHVVDANALRSPLSMVQPILVAHTQMLAREVKKLHARAKAIKAESAALLAKLKLSGRAVIERGPVTPALLKHCRGGETLLVVGHRGLDALDRFMLGSVSSHVVTHADCPVLLIKEAPPRSLRRLVLATDGSKESEKAERFLIKQFGADPSKLEVIVVHVMPFLRYPELKDAAATLVHARAERLSKEGFEVIEAPRLGRPADEIMKAADRHKADLIVAGAKGIGALAGLLLGSVSRKLVQHSACSVLIVR